MRTAWRTLRVILLIGAAAFVVSFLLGLLTLFDIVIVANYIAFLLAALGHAIAAALVVGLVFEFLPQTPTRFRIGRVFGVAVLALLGVGLFLLDRLIYGADLGSTWKLFYAAFCVVGLLAGVWWAVRLFTRPERDFRVVRLAGYTFGGTVGALVGVVALLALVLGLAARRQSQLRESDIDLPVISAIDGPYVALGDSYSAGEGLRPFQDGTGSINEGGDDCHRSDDAYPELLAFADPAVTLEFRACSGAVTADMFTGFRKHLDDGSVVSLAPQVEGPPRPDVRLVTLTVGGNDLVFTKIVTACFLRDDCVRTRFNPPGIDDEHPQLTFPGPAVLEIWAAKAATLLSERLGEVYSGVRTAFPEARIVVIGYPNLFPDDRARWRPDDCASVMRRVSFRERGRLRALTGQLNDMIYARAVAADLEFVSPAAAWDDHESCGTEEEYTNSLTLVRPLGVDGSSYHPNRNGQRQLAALVACYLTLNPEPPVPTVDGSDVAFVVDGFVELDALGLVPPPGSMAAPLLCP